MPVVNREIERSIVQRAQARGMSQDQIKQAVLKYRESGGTGISAPTAPTQTPSQQEPGGFQRLVQGVAKPLLKTATNVLNFGEGVADLIKGDVQGAHDAATKERDFGYFGQDIRPVGVDEEGQFKNVGGFAKDVVGTGAELASYAAPVGVLGKAGTVGTKVAQTAVAGAGGGALGAFGQGLQQDQSFGKTLGQTAQGALLGGVLGGAIPGVGALAGKVIKPAVNFAGKVGSGALGLSTGVGSGAFETLVKNTPETIRYARQAAREGVESIQNKALEASRTGLREIKKAASDEYVGRLSEIAKNQTPLDNQLQEIRKSVLDSLQSKGVKLKEGKKLNNLNFERTRLGRNGDVVEGAFNELMNWKDATPKGLDELKKNIDDWRDVFSNTEKGTPAYKAVDEMFRSVRGTLETNVPGYKEMTSRWSQLAELTSEIEDALSLKNSAKTDTTIRKLTSTLKRDNELRKAMLQKVQEASGEDIESMLSGAALSSWTPRGLQGVASGLLGPTGVTLSVINPSNIPALLVYLGASSPRLLAEGIALAKKMTGLRIPESTKRKFMNLLIQATREAISGNDDQDSMPKS